MRAGNYNRPKRPSVPGGRQHVGGVLLHPENAAYIRGLLNCTNSVSALMDDIVTAAREGKVYSPMPGVSGNRWMPQLIGQCRGPIPFNR